VSHPGIDKVSFTGSTVAGKKIGAICGGQLKRFSLELGGKSAAILLDDVNLAEALPMLLPNAIMNNGEACIARPGSWPPGTATRRWSTPWSRRCRP